MSTFHTRVWETELIARGTTSRRVLTAWLSFDAVGRIVVGNPARVISSDLFCIGVVDVAFTIFAANTGAAVAPVPVFETVLVESNSFKIVPANTDRRSAVWVLFKLTDPETTVGNVTPTMSLAP